ncbi:DUF2214 family protein [Ramlibacter sp.]|uniref:DUF2214 family protein n=1 Tax=Ramlibacter sp. TaxID=1917967 RepID=UPI003D13291C
MTQEALLAYAHLLAILTMVVFLTSEAALCRNEWMSTAVVERLGKVDIVYGISALVVLATGIARVYMGAKGHGWYLANTLLYVKIGMFAVVALLSIPPTVQILRWRRALHAQGSLPPAHEVRHVRRLVMVQAHLIAIVPLPAVFLARGFGA